MIRTESENQRWWSKLSALERSELFESLFDATEGQTIQDFVESLWSQFANQREFSPKQLAALRNLAEQRGFA